MTDSWKSKFNSTLLCLVVVVSTLTTAGVGGVAAAPQQVTVSVGNTPDGVVAANTNSAVEVPIVVDEAPDGLANVDRVTVSVGNTAVAQPLGVNGSASDFPTTTGAGNGSSYVSFNVSAPDNASAPGGPEEPPENSRGIVLGSVVLDTGSTVGATNVTVSVIRGNNQSLFAPGSVASTVEFTPVGATLNVSGSADDGSGSDDGSGNDTSTPTLDARLGNGSRIPASAGGTVEVPVVVDYAPDGLAAVRGVNVSVADTTAAVIASDPVSEDASPINTSLSVRSSGPAHVNFSVSAFSNDSAPGGPEEPPANSQDIVVGAVRLNTSLTNSSTTLDLDVERGYTQTVLSRDAASDGEVSFATADETLDVDGPDAGSGAVRLRVGNGTERAASDDIVRLPVVLEEAPDGVASLENLTLSVSNTSVATIAGFDDASSEFPDVAVTDRRPGSITVGAIASNRSTAPGGPEEPVGNSREILVGELVLNTSSGGTATVDVVRGSGQNQSVFDGSEAGLRLLANGSELRVDSDDDGSSTPTLDARLGDGSIAALSGERVEVPIVVDEAPNGIARVEGVNVTVRNGTIASLDGLNNSSSEFPSNRVDVNADRQQFVNYSASALSNSSAPGGPEEPPANSQDIVVGTVVVEASGNGTTSLGLDVYKAYDQNALSFDSSVRVNSEVDVRTADASLIVRDEPFLNGVPGTASTSPPTDPDGDGLYEDVDGDGTVDFLDVVSLSFADLDAIDADQVQRDALDFDGDGRISDDDVAALGFEFDPGATPSNGTVNVSAGDARVDPGNATRVPVVLEQAPDGLKKYDVGVQVANGSVADVAGVADGDLQYVDATIRNRTAVSFRGYEVGSNVSSGASDVVLGYVELANTTRGTTAIEIDATLIEDDNGNAPRVAVDDGSLTVDERAPRLRVTNVTGPASVRAGDTLAVNATVANIGDARADDRAVELLLDLDRDGRVEATEAVDGQRVGLAAGASTSVTFAVDTANLTDGTYEYNVATLWDDTGGTVEVLPPNPFPGGVPGVSTGDPPTDLDGDGRYEDVNGDGSVDRLDVAELRSADWSLINGDAEQSAALDFDGSGQLDYLDTVTLLFELGTSTPDNASTQTVAVGSANAIDGGSARVPVTLSAAPDGVQVAQLELTLEDPSVADVGSFESGAVPAYAETGGEASPTVYVVDRSDDSITVEIADLGDDVGPTSGPITLGYLRLTNASTGTAAVDVTADWLTDDAGREIPNAPAAGRLDVRAAVSVAFDDRSVPNGSTTVTVDEVRHSDASHYVVVHRLENGSLSPPVGVSKLLSPGVSRNVTVNLSRTLDAGDDFDAVRANDTLVAMVHAARADGSLGSPITRDGSPVTDRADVTVLPTVSLAFEPSSLSTNAGVDETVRVVARGVEDGVGAVEFEILTGNSTEVRNVSVAGSPVGSSVRYGNGSASVAAYGLDTNDTGTVEVATVRLAATTGGTDRLRLRRVAVGTESARDYVLTGTGTTTVDVASVPAVGSAPAPPTNVDDDPQLEDVNGDGSFSVVDVQALFENQDDPAVADNPGRFDFTGDGDADTVDVYRLFLEAGGSVGSGSTTAAAAVPTRTAGTAGLELRPNETTVAPDGTIAVDLIATGATDGVGAYEFTFEAGDGSVLSVAGVETPTDARFGPTVDAGANESSVTVRAAALAAPNETRIATVRLRAEGAGNQTLSVSDVVLGTTDGVEYATTASGAVNATVEAGPGDVTDNGVRARDPKPEAGYEDVNGVNGFTFLDVIEFLFTYDSLDPAYFDYDGNGELEFLDVITLLFRL